MLSRKYNSPNNGKEMFFSGIYKITVKNTNYIYIGSTKRFAKRFKEHFVGLQSNCHANNKMQNIFNKYGIENFEIEIIELHTKYEKTYLFEREQFWMDFYKNDKSWNVVNIAPNAIGGVGGMSEELKQYYSVKYSGEGNPHYGKTHSEEMRKEISDKLKISHQINKQKHLERIKKVAATGEYKRRREKAWENPSEKTLQHLINIQERNRNLTKEERELKNQKLKETRSQNFGKIRIFQQGDEKEFKTYQECADYIQADIVSVRASLKENRKCKNYTISREFEGKGLKKVIIKKEHIDLVFLNTNDCSKYLEVSGTAVSNAIKFGYLCKGVIVERLKP